MKNYHSPVQDYDLGNEVRTIKNLPCLKPVTMIKPFKSDEQLSIRSINILFLSFNICKLVLTLKMGEGCRNIVTLEINPKVYVCMCAR